MIKPKALKEIRDELVFIADDSLSKDVEILTGAEAENLPIGSAILVYATPGGLLIRRPNGAQVCVSDGRWVGPHPTADLIHSEFWYLVLWRKPE